MNRLKQFFKLLLALAGLAAAAAYAVIFNNTSGWLLLSFYLGFLLLNLAALLFPLKRLTFQTNSPIRTAVGRPFSLALTVSSRKAYWVPGLSLQLPEYSVEKVFLAWYRGRLSETAFELTAGKRGIFQGTVVEAEAGDWFGFFTKRRRFPIEPEIIVLPETDADAANWALEISKLHRLDGFGERTAHIRNFRDYRRGDPLKLVDWKQSARQRDLIIREYEEHRETPTILLFWGRDSEDFELCLSRYWTLQNQLKGQAELQQFLVTQTGTAVLRDERQFALALGFAELPPVPEFKNKQLLIFTTTVDPILTAQVALWQKNNQVSVYDLAELSPVAVADFETRSGEKGGWLT